MIEIVFETHQTSEDNERGIATGWNHGCLSALGRDQARELGARRRDDGLAAVFSSDLRRSVETAELAFGGTVPLLLDWRLRECDYGERNGASVEVVHGSDRSVYLDVAYPGGESIREAVTRVGRFLDDLALRWNGQRVLLIGHVATQWGLEHHLGGRELQDVVAGDFVWQPGWEYRLES